MNRGDVLEIIQSTSWTGPFWAADQARSIAALEAGKIVFFPNLAFELEPSETAWLKHDASDPRRKNVSFDPRTKQVRGTKCTGEELAQLGAMIDRFGTQADTLVRNLIPRYAAKLERARTSFRPIEIAERDYSPRHNDRLMHVDAFPTRPLHGRRILRLFANVAPGDSPREWRVGESFPDFARKYMPTIRGPVPGQSWLFDKLGLTKGRRSDYDHYMLKLHDAAKMDSGYQDDAPQVAVSFPSRSVWMCFTDSVLHAAMSGRLAFEQTFHLPVEAMAEPILSPLRVLEGLAARPLAS